MHVSNRSLRALVLAVCLAVAGVAAVSATAVAFDTRTAETPRLAFGPCIDPLGAG